MLRFELHFADSQDHVASDIIRADIVGRCNTWDIDAFSLQEQVGGWRDSGHHMFIERSWCLSVMTDDASKSSDLVGFAESWKRAYDQQAVFMTTQIVEGEML